MCALNKQSCEIDNDDYVNVADGEEFTWKSI